MNQQRLSELHKTGADVSEEIHYVPITEIRTTDRSHPAYDFGLSGPPGTTAPTIGRVHHFVELGAGPEPVAQICQRYYALLEHLVREFKKTVCADGGQA